MAATELGTILDSFEFMAKHPLRLHDIVIGSRLYVALPERMHHHPGRPSGREGIEIHKDRTAFSGKSLGDPNSEGISAGRQIDGTAQ
jgi:hypothetical protein